MIDSLDALQELALLYLDGQASPSDVAELQRLLAESPEHRDAFLVLATRSRLLRESSNGAFAAREPEPVIARPATAMKREPGAVRRLSVYTYAAMGIAAALAIGAAVVAVYLSTVTPGSGRAATGTEPVATVIETDGDATVMVNDDIALPGQTVTAGDYSIDSGSAEFLLTNRVSVSMRGRTRLTLHHPTSVSLDRGAAEFTIPRGVTGFTVHLPDMSRIVDLGTAFRVNVDDAGEARLRVTEGKVRWTPPTPDASPMELTAGQSARIEDGRVVLTSVPLLEESFEGPMVPGAVAGQVVMEDPKGWVGASKIAGFGWDRRERVSKADGAFTTPFGEYGYALRYANAALTTAGDHLNERLAAGVTYTLSFHVAQIDPDGSALYRVELVAFSEGDDRTDDESGIVFAAADGRVSTNDMSASDRVVFTADAADLNLGRSLAIRLRGITKEEVVFDQIELTAEPADAAGLNHNTNPTPNRPSEHGDRSDNRRDADGPSSENSVKAIGDTQ